MKFLSEYRDQKAAEKLARAIRLKTTRPCTIMEICGGQTHTIVKSGLEDLLPRNTRWFIDQDAPSASPRSNSSTKPSPFHSAATSSSVPSETCCVSGSTRSLFDSKAEGGDVRIVYSPLDAVKLAKNNPEKQVVFFAVGFETTAPANAMAW